MHAAAGTVWVPYSLVADEWRKGLRDHYIFRCQVATCTGGEIDVSRRNLQVRRATAIWYVAKDSPHTCNLQCSHSIRLRGSGSLRHTSDSRAVSISAEEFLE